MSKMWSGRFDGSIDHEFENWQRSFDLDQRLLPYELAASRAYARALQQIGMLTADECQAVVHGLDTIERTTTLPIRDAESEDVHHYVERTLAALIGDTALKLHSGRSRNEQIATDLRLFLRDHAATTHAAIVELCSSLLHQAKAHHDAVMPAYTHLQKAEPVSVAHFLLAYFEMFRRDSDRLIDALARINLCPLGSGPIAGSTLPLDREFLSSELGFSAPLANSLDATSSRDFALEYVQALTHVALHMSQMSAQFILFATQEFGFLRLPDAFSTGSSAMPQKKNPDGFELIRAKAARVCGCETAIAGILQALPLGYNKDLQEIQPALFDACDTTLACLRILSRTAAALSFDTDRMRASAATGYMNAMAAATYLAHRGVPFREAHE